MHLTLPLLKRKTFGTRTPSRFLPKVKARDKIRRWKLVSGDTVEIVNPLHRDKGKRGVIKKVLRKSNRVIVEGVNLVKRHIAGTPEMKGGIFTKEAPLHYSMVNLVDPTVDKPTRVGYKFLEDGTKVRVSKKSGTVLPKPMNPRYLARKQRVIKDGPKDTPVELVQEKTFFKPHINDLNNHMKDWEVKHALDIIFKARAERQQQKALEKKEAEKQQEELERKKSLRTEPQNVEVVNIQ
mmetsp:Transcript_16854/g.23453  ORF Transcript_16854/g.23453 Transcript_16854/m.23453 type:complete len:238 (+) Transcript_16854:45-758(+)